MHAGVAAPSVRASAAWIRSGSCPSGREEGWCRAGSGSASRRAAHHAAQGCRNNAARARARAQRSVPSGWACRCGRARPPAVALILTTRSCCTSVSAGTVQDGPPTATARQPHALFVPDVCAAISARLELEDRRVGSSSLHRRLHRRQDLPPAARRKAVAAPRPRGGLSALRRSPSPVTGCPWARPAVICARSRWPRRLMSLQR